MEMQMFQNNFFGFVPTQEQLAVQNMQCFVPEGSPSLMMDSSLLPAAYPVDFKFEDYCLCNLNLSPMFGIQDNTSGIMTQNIRRYSDASDLSLTHQTRSTSSTHRDRTLYMKDCLDKLHSSLSLQGDSCHYLITGRKKLSYKAARVSSRRSKYTGVFKNGTKWQALIAIRMKKTYIQTYATEYEAARAFDCLSIVLKGFSAVTNFNYTKNDILLLLQEHKDIVSKFCY